MSQYNIINFDVEKYSKDKKTVADTIGYNTIIKLQSMFKWKGLPETIPAKWLEVMLVTQGFAFFTKVGDNLYAFQGGLGGEPDPYYQPTICVVANPALKFNKECQIGVDGVLMSNDTLRQGVIPTIGKYAGLLAENTITTRIGIIMARITNIMSAGDDDTIASALEYLRQVEEGKLGIIEESPFLEDLKIQAGASQATTTRLTDLIEMEQYLKASLYNELGLEANYNMKREAVNSSEAQLGDDALQPFIDNMLKCRQEACLKINDMFGTDIWVDFASAWADNEAIREAGVELIEEQAESEESTGDALEAQADAQVDPEDGNAEDMEVSEEESTEEVEVEPEPEIEPEPESEAEEEKEEEDAEAEAKEDEEKEELEEENVNVEISDPEPEEAVIEEEEDEETIEEENEEEEDEDGED